jgi:hypothetical protein
LSWAHDSSQGCHLWLSLVTCDGSCHQSWLQIVIYARDWCRIVVCLILVLIQKNVLFLVSFTPPLSVISNQLSAISNQQSFINNQQSTISNQQSVINNQLSVINNHLSTIIYKQLVISKWLSANSNQFFVIGSQFSVLSYW